MTTPRSTPHAPGDTLSRFNREYVFYIPADSEGTPQPGRAGTWCLNADQEIKSDDGDDTPPETDGSGVLNTGLGTVLLGAPLYIRDDNGYLDLADASSLATARVIGVAAESGKSGGESVRITRNTSLSVFNTTGLISDDTGGSTLWIAGANYFLSTTPGQYTRTAPTGTGNVVSPVLEAYSLSQVFVEIQTPMVV